ncbi:hypothetical protein DL93DRAFT_1667787 [Clavulina sp. PMI_390]|nr:hypothetical protein DL93DRAFT_1667787 [Clavulina sp. PMI_390]
MSTASAVWPGKRSKGFSGKPGKKGEVKEIVFDDEARRDYLTGFHKRKVAKKEARVAKAKEKARAEQLEFRREKRRELAKQARDNAAAVERAYGGTAADDDLANEAGPSTPHQPAEEELEFENEEQLATVTVVEDFDVQTDILGLRPQHVGDVEDNSDDDDDDDDMADDSSTPRAGPSHSRNKNISSRSSVPSKSTRTSTSTSSTRTSQTITRTSSSSTAAPKKKPNPKSMPYLSKAERKLDKLKQKAKRTEHMEDRKLKSKMSGRGGGSRGKGGKGSKGKPKRRG